MISCEKVSKNISGTSILEEVSFTAELGELVGILGPNGAGKTTTMRILSTYLAPSSGRVTLGGFDVVKEAEEVRKLIGILPESPPLYDELNVEQYVSFMGSLRGLSGSELKQNLESTLERCRLLEKRRVACGALSKGFRQKVGLAAAIIGDPKILLLDEPTSGLDPREVTEIRALIRELKEERTILFSSHILSEISEMCDRLVMFVRGRTVLEGTLSDLTAETSLEKLFLNALTVSENRSL